MEIKKDFSTKEDFENTYTFIYSKVKNLEKTFKEMTKTDKKLQEYFKEDNPTDRYTHIEVASNYLAGIDLRNINRKNGNLNGAIEKYPYSKEQISIIRQYQELSDTLRHLIERSESF